MKQSLYSLLLALIFATNTLPLTVNSTLLEHKKSGKRVLLLGDAHDYCIEMLFRFAVTIPAHQQFTHSTRATFDAIKRQQGKAFASFAARMFVDNNKQYSGSMMISEISTRTCKNFISSSNSKSLETMYMLPHLCMEHIAQSGSTEEEKCMLIEQAMKQAQSKNFGKNAFQLPNEMILIASNCWRDNSLTWLLQSFRLTEDLVSLKKTVRPDIAAITIDDLKKFLMTWQKLFAKMQHKETITAQFLTFIENAIQAGHISEATTLIDAAITSRQDKVVQEVFYELALKLLKNICDVELLHSIRSFEKNNRCTYLILNAGMKHTKHIRNCLMKDGYHIVEQRGNHALPSTKIELISCDQMLTLFSQTFNELEKESPLALLPKLFQA